MKTFLRRILKIDHCHEQWRIKYKLEIYYRKLVDEDLGTVHTCDACV